MTMIICIRLLREHVIILLIILLYSAVLLEVCLAESAEIRCTWDPLGEVDTALNPKHRKP